MGLNGKRIKKLFRKKSLSEIKLDIAVQKAKLQREKLKSELTELRRQRMFKPAYRTLKTFRKPVKKTTKRKKRKKATKKRKKRRAVFYLE